jgi:hypothetical protein
MVAHHDGRFICCGCGHVEIPNVEFECNCGNCTELTKFHPEVMTVQCEIIEVAHSEDAAGYRCGKDAPARCGDCGTSICDAHSETCAACVEVFCKACLAFHNREHHQKKPAARPERQRRKSA